MRQRMLTTCLNSVLDSDVHKELILVMLNTGTHADLFDKKFKK